MDVSLLWIPATLLAAQGARESGFNPNAVSPKGARGIAQFMEPTWRAYGTDANGDGIASPLDPADAMATTVTTHAPRITTPTRTSATSDRCGASL